MVDFNINNLAGRGVTPSSSANFDSLLNLARGQLENITNNVKSLITQQTIQPSQILLDAAGIKIQVPQLANLITGQQDILLKTALPLDKNQPINIQVNNSNITLVQERPVLQLQGQVTQNNNSVPQRFTAEIPLQSLATQNPQGAQIINNTSAQNADQVVRNFLPTSQVQTFTNNLSETIRPQLPQNLQNLNLSGQNNLNIQITSFTTPSGQQVNIDQNNLTVQNITTQPNQQTQPNQPATSNTGPNTTTPQNINTPNTNTLIQNQPTTQNTNQPQVIRGQVEIFPDANEALIRTEFGTFRVNNLTQLPNGSNISFTITGNATQQTNDAQTILNLNPTSIQALKLSLEASDSPLQNLIRTLSSAQGISQIAQRLFPHPLENNAAAKSLLFASNAAKGSPEGWLGDDGQMIINNIPEADGGLNRLSELFGAMRNFAGRGDQPVSQDWNSYIIPFFDGNKLSYVTVQVQRDPEGEENARTTKNKRKFILELEQDNLGRVAIEGLYSKLEGKVNNLDVVLKTENPVDDEFAAELSAIFNDTSTAYGFSGSISFAPFTTQTPQYTDVSKILGDGIVI